MKLVIIEALLYLQIPAVWYLFRRFAGRNVTGEMTAGVMIGVFNEFATAPLWDYHLRLNIYKHTPLAVVLGWGVMFTLVTFISEKLYCFFLGKAVIEAKDKRIFIFDVISGALVAFPLETLGVKLGVWSYRYEILQWDWGMVPFFKMPYEALVGYSLFMLIGPTFVRYWEKALE
ncbi:MAG: hypothetical protein WCW52_08750 [Elusimicrobiales bacterium]|jgi:hypothetical protein